MSTGDRIRQLRKKAGLTQAEMAEKLGMGRANYSHIENNRVKPSGETMQKIADLLNTSVDYLFGRTNDPSNKPISVPDNPDIRAILRASEKMTEEQAKKLRQVAELMFPEAFRE